MGKSAFTLTESLVATAILAVIGALAAPIGWQVYERSSLAISAANIRQLNIGAVQYLAEHRGEFWKYRAPGSAASPGTIWWFGFESDQSARRPEGSREFDATQGPLGGYIPKGLRPDPSFRLGGKAFKPKYQFGYLGIGYNVHLGGGWLGNLAPRTLWQLPNPGQVVVFSTSAQVNDFQRPASRRNPMIEEFYGIDEKEVTVHFRHHGLAMVGFADGSAGFLPMDESTRDSRAPEARVGRFAPQYNRKYLE